MAKKRIRRSFTYRGKRYFGEGDTVEKAIADLERIHYELEHSFHVVGNMRVEELADLYYRRLKNKDITPKTLKMRRSIIDRFILPAIGHMRVPDVREIHIMMIMDDLASKYTDQTLEKTMSVLNGMFKLARANHFSSENSCLYIERPKGKPSFIRREATLDERLAYAGKLPWLDMVIYCSYVNTYIGNCKEKLGGLLRPLLLFCGISWYCYVFRVACYFSRIFT